LSIFMRICRCAMPTGLLPRLRERRNDARVKLRSGKAQDFRNNANFSFSGCGSGINGYANHRRRPAAIATLHWPTTSRTPLSRGRLPFLVPMKEIPYENYAPADIRNSPLSVTPRPARRCSAKPCSRVAASSPHGPHRRRLHGIGLYVSERTGRFRLGVAVAHGVAARSSHHDTPGYLDLSARIGRDARRRFRAGGGACATRVSVAPTGVDYATRCAFRK